MHGCSPTFLSLFCACAALGAARARADGYGATAKVAKKLAATHGEDASASGTSLDLTQRVTTPRTLADVVRESPGARVTSTGGLGAFSAVSLRGADNDETMVMLGEIPLVTPEGGAFDLSLFPAELFERIDVFRGGAPVWLGSGAIGGVLRLVPRTAQRTRGSGQLGVGSFGTHQLDVDAEVVAPEGPAVRSHVLVRDTRGNYPYRDDNGTVLGQATGDDSARRRRNAELTEGAGFSDVSLPLWGGEAHLLALGVAKTGGFPGPASQPTPAIHRAQLLGLLAASYARERRAGRRAPRHRLALVGSGTFGRNRYTDLLGQLGTSKQTGTDDASGRGVVRAAATVHITPWLAGTVLGSYALDRYRPRDAFAFPRPAPSERQSLAAAAELSLHGALGPVHAELRPSARVEWSDTELHAIRSVSGPLQTDRRVLAPTFRLGAVVAPLRGLALSASCATGTRLPSMFELFGDRGLTLPSPTLVPVSSRTIDGGATLLRSFGPWHASAELRGFGQWRDHAIVMARSNQWQAYFENQSRVSQRGLEGGLTLGYGRLVSLYASFTLLDSENARGRRLPFRPRQVAYARPQLSIPFERRLLSSLSGAAELWHRSFAFVDSANVNYSPVCTKLGVSAAVGLLGGRVRLAGRLDDALDARCSDLLGYPLPGRSFFFALTIQETRDEG